MNYIDNNGKFNHGKWMRERTLNESPNRDVTVSILENLDHVFAENKTSLTPAKLRTSFM